MQLSVPNPTVLCCAVLCRAVPCRGQTADDLLCRALYALEGAWVHGFDPTTGNVRLDFENAPNRGLFLALFRHAQVGSGPVQGCGQHDSLCNRLGCCCRALEGLCMCE